ncbi:MAG: asparagine synthase (glutamine-hydrolyzing) [Lachnospiraceae bacterium]
MCGIAGIVRFTGNGTDDILNMNRAMYRRGPDAGDYWLDTENRVVFGHRRLSIVDLSPNGAQPMVSADGRYVMVYNGEIYNYREIEQQMRMDGFNRVLRGTSDTEVILEAFAFYGVERTLQKMKGMFALALYDRQEKKIYLTRDRVGEKPLYFGFVGDRFVFASDLASIKAVSGFDNEINTEVFSLYFQYGYIPTPYSIYRGIRKLKPGTWLTLSLASMEYESHTYWDMAQVASYGQSHLFKGSETEAADRLEELLQDAVRGQMIADVPLGAFLSGGIDSALVVSMMQSVSERPVRTFTIGFDVEKYNEAEYAAAIARHLGTKHTELYIDRNDACEVMKQMAECFSEPFADSSQIPTMLVSKMTREHVTVSLSGDAGDELFGGYNTYRVAEQEMEALKKRYHRLPKGARRVIGKACLGMAGKQEMLYKVGNYLTMETAEDAHRWIGLEDVRMLYLPKDRTRLPDAYHEYAPGFLPGTLNNLMLMDLVQYHPDDILVKVDRAGMFYSLETRIPLLDKDVVEFAWTLPEQYKYSEGVTKRVMRDVLYRHVPKEMMERPKKGFSIPLHEWLRQGSMRSWAEDIISDGKKYLSELIDQSMVGSYWKDYTEHGVWTEKIWYILIIEQWLLENG